MPPAPPHDLLGQDESTVCYLRLQLVQEEVIGNHPWLEPVVLYECFEVVIVHVLLECTDVR